MRRRSLRIATFSVLWVVGLLTLGGAAFYWRLSQGPVSLAFLGRSIETAINRQLPGFRISLGESELELDTDTGTPHVRVRNIVLSDADGVSIASAPKAGVALDATSLLSGTISIQSLDLIGPRVNIRRNLDGTLELGISNDGSRDDQEILVDPEKLESGKSDNTQRPQSPLVSGSKVLDLLAGGGSGSLSKLEEIRLSRGLVSLYDEANDATWIAPRADLAFRRVASGFVIAAKAEVASGGDPWQIESSITYRQQQRNFTANVAIANLVPANVADEIYAFSQFARLSTPLGGNFEIEAEENGQLTKIDGQIFAAAGQISLPEFISKPILIDEGTLHIRQQGSGQPIEILESSILMGGSRADVKGKISPRKGDEGRLNAYDVELSAANVSVDAQGTVKDPVFVDRVSYKGSFAVEEQKVVIDDLVVMAGAAGVRLRGIVTGGEESSGIQAAGRLRDVNAELLKKLWPPILAPKTRTWINENVIAGNVTDGVFEVNFPPDSLARAQKSKVLPAGAVDLSFKMANVETRYFKKLPVLRGGTGKASLKDGAFGLDINSGSVTLPSGKKLELAAGRFDASDLLSEAVPGSFNFDIKGGIGELLEFASLPDLNLIKEDLSKFPNVAGDARVLVALKLPLIKDVPRSRVTITQQVTLSNASVAGIMPNVDLTDGQFEIQLKPDSVTVSGPAKLNGVASKINWAKSRSGGDASIQVETTLTQKLRDKMGVDLDAYLSGDMPVTLDIKGGSEKTISVNADLSAISMKVTAAGWSRAAVKGTTASFELVDEGKAGKLVRDLKILGKGLRLSGDVRLDAKNALRVVDMKEIRLSEDDVFSVRMEPFNGVTKLTVTGNTFDARPYIKKTCFARKGRQ